MIQWLLVMLLVLGIALDKGIIVIPDRYNPWAPISLDASPGPWFRYKLSRLGDDPEACRSVLASDPAQRFSAMEDATVGDCSLTNLVRMQGGDVAVQPPVMTRCPLAVAWAMYERGLSEAASRQLGTGIARIEHMAASPAAISTDGRPAGVASTLPQRRWISGPSSPRMVAGSVCSMTGVRGLRGASSRKQGSTLARCSVPFWGLITMPPTPIIFISAWAAECVASGVSEHPPVLRRWSDQRLRSMSFESVAAPVAAPTPPPITAPLPTSPPVMAAAPAPTAAPTPAPLRARSPVPVPHAARPSASVAAIRQLSVSRFMPSSSLVSELLIP